MDPEPTPDPPFTITRQDEKPRMDDAGVTRYDWTVYFTTPSKVNSQVQVSEDDYTPEKVAAMIMDKVRTIEAVHQLGRAPAAS